MLVPGVLALVVLSYSPEDAVCSQIRGDVSSYLQTYENQGAMKTQPYVSLRIGSNDIYGGGNRSVGFNLYGRWTDQRSSFSNNKYVLYSSYIDVKGLPAMTRVKIGRQFCYNTAGSATIDGISVQYKPHRNWKIEALGGSKPSSTEPNGIRSLADAGVFAGSVSTSVVRNVNMSAGWYLSSRDGNTERNRLGGEADYRSARVRVFGSSTYSLPDKNLANTSIRLSLHPDRWYLSAHYRYRQPSVPYQSLFSLVDSEPVNELRFEIRKEVYRRTAAYVRFSRTSIGTDGVSRYQIGIRSARFTIGWLKQDGYRGKRNALVGSAQFVLSSKVATTISANLSRYKVQEEQEELNDSYVGTAGIQWRPVNTLTVGGEVQYIRDAVLEDNLILLLRVSKSVTIRSQ